MENLVKEGERKEVLFAEKIILQSDAYYRFTSDAVALSRFATVKAGDNVADFCAGCGIVGLHAMCLNPRIAHLTLFELQQPLSDMSRRTAEINGDKDRVTALCTPLQQVADYNGAFDLILCNPPYFKLGDGEGKQTQSELLAKKEVAITLAEITQIASKKLRFGGRLAMCHIVERLTDVLTCMRAAKIEPKRLQFLARKEGGEPYLLLVEGVKGGKPGLKMLPTEVNRCSTL